MNRILLLLDHKENQRLLSNVLTGHYDARLADSDAALDEPFDLAVVGGTALDRLRKRIESRKRAAQPAFLPFLLVTSRSDVGMATRHLWKTVDDLIVTPIEKVELHARVASLLETRRLSLEATRTLVQRSPLAIIRTDAQGVIAAWNPAAERLLGWGSNEAIGRPLTEILHDVDAELQSLCHSTLRGDEPALAEMRHTRRDGEALTIEVSAAPLFSPGGEPSGCAVVIADVTARARAEEVLRRANEELERRVAMRTAELQRAKEQAETADRLKSAFLATMSHELRTPLNSIIGFTGILLGGLPGPLNDEQRTQLLMVQDSANHLLDLITDILDLSKIEAGQLLLEREPFDLRSAIEKSVAKTSPLAEKKQLRLAVAVAPGVGTVVGDKRRVEQVLLNLLSNAVKFTDKGEVRVECMLEGECVVVRVSDTGIGIRAEDVAALFEPFRQLDAAANRRYQGTGLGLSICKRLVEMWGGAISVRSEWGRGSTFAFSLPLGRPASATG